MLALAKDIAHQARGRRGKKEQHEVLTGTATTTSVGRASPWAEGNGKVQVSRPTCSRRQKASG